VTTLHAQPDDLIRAIESYQRAKRRQSAIRWTLTATALLSLLWAVWR
jgi:hypothetical protein